MRVPASGHVACDIEDVLGREGEAGQRSVVGAGQVGVAIGNEGVQGAGHGYSISSFSVTPNPGRSDGAIKPSSGSGSSSQSTSRGERMWSE